MVDISAVRRRKVRRTNSVERKHLLCSGLVLRQETGVRSRTCIGQADQVHVGSDIHLHSVVARVGFGEVEYQISTALRKSVQRLRTPVEHVIEGLVAELG